MVKKLLYIILIILALGYGAWRVANSQWLFSFAIKQANAFLSEDELQIEYQGFNGKLLSQLDIDELLLKDSKNGDSLLIIKQISISTNPFSLLGEVIAFNSLEVGRIQASVAQDTTNALWRFITKERAPSAGIPSLSFEKLKIYSSDISFSNDAFALLLSDFSFELGATYQPKLGLTLALPSAQGKLSYFPVDNSGNNLSWDFLLNASSSGQPFGQLAISTANETTHSSFIYPIPQLLQANIESDLANKATSILNIGALFSEKNQLTVALPFTVDKNLQQLKVMASGSMNWQNPTHGLKLADSLVVPEIASISLTNESDILLSSAGLQSDSIIYSLAVHEIGTKKAFGIQNLGLNLDGIYHFKNHQSSHNLVILSQEAPEFALNVAIQTTYKDPIIYGKIKSTSDKKLPINKLFVNDLPTDFTLNGWDWVQDLNFNLTDNFFEGSLKLELPNSVVNEIPFTPLLINGRYSAIGANLDLLAKSVAGNIGIQLFGVHFEDAIEHELKVDLQDIDLGQWLAIKGFSTKLSATGSIIGSGKNPIETESAIDLYFKESFIQNAKIDTARLTASLEKGLLTVNQLSLKSDLAEGLFNASLNLNDVFNPKNTLEGFLELKNPTSLAPLFGLDTLNATGYLTTKINPDMSGKITLTGSFDIDNLRFGIDKEIGKIDGVLSIPMEKEPTLFANFNMYNATISQAKLSNLSNSISAKLGTDFIQGKTLSHFQNGEDYSADIRSHFTHIPQFNTTQITLDTIFVRHKTDSLILQEPALIDIAENSLLINPIRLISNNGTSELTLQFQDINKQLSGYLKATSFDLYKTQQCFLVEQPISGSITTNLALSGTASSLKINGPFNFTGLGFDELKIPALSGNVSLNDHELSLITKLYANLSDTSNLANFSLKTNLSLLDSVNATLSIPKNPLKNWQAIHPSLVTALNADFSATASIAGIITSPTIEGIFTLNQLNDGSNTFADSLILHFGQHTKSNGFNLLGSAYLQANKALALNVESPMIGFNSTASESSIFENFPFSADSVLRVALSATEFDLQFLNSIKPINEQIKINKGYLNTKIYASGTLDNLMSNGNLVVDQLDINWLDLGLSHQASYLNLALEHDKITLQNAFLRGDQGSVRMRGSWAFPKEKKTENPIDLSVKFENFLSLNNAIGRFRTDGSLQFSGNNAEPKLNGQLQLSRGKLAIDALENREIEEVKLNQQDTLSYFDFDNWLTGLQSTIEVSITEDISIRNRSFPRVEIYPSGKLNVVKAKNQEDWQVFGSLLATKGSVELLGKRFQLEDSGVDFDGNPMNPNLSIQAMYRIPKPHEVTIWYDVHGRLEEPSFSYRSNPEMELQNMISYLLFNKPFYALESWEQSLAATDQDAGGSATNIAIQLLANRVEQIAAQRLGIDLVQIDNTRTGSRNATTLKTGWYLNEKTFFAIMNELGVTNPQTQFILEYLIGRDLNLVFTQTNDDGTRLDVRWQYDY